MTTIANDLLQHVDFDLKMNASSGYAPSEGVIATRAMRAAEERLATMLCAVHLDTKIERAHERKGHTFQVMIGDLVGAEYRAKLAELFAFVKANGEALGVSGVRIDAPADGGGLYVTMDASIYTIARICAPLYLAKLVQRGAKIDGVTA